MFITGSIGLALYQGLAPVADCRADSGSGE